MKTILMTVFVGAWALSGAAAQAGPSDAEAAALMTKYNCQSCHSTDKKLVGPAFREIAQKYAGSAGAILQTAGPAGLGGRNIQLGLKLTF